MKIIVTGSTSPIGKILINRLIESGHTVVPLGGSESDVWTLGMTIPLAIEGDALIHLAHDREFTFRENSQAIRLIVDSFSGYKIFLSSMSAHSKSKSNYGQSKFASEDCFLETSGAVLRAGVVYGPEVEGIYKTCQSMIYDLPIIPLPFNGTSRMFTTHIEDLCEEFLDVLNSRRSGIFLAANPWPISFKKLLRRIEQQNPKSGIRIYISISPTLTRLILAILTILKIKNPTLDSLRSLDTEVSLLELSNIAPPKTSFRIL